MILIYTKHISPRLTYITRFIFGNILEVTCKLTTNRDDFLSFSGPKINYSLDETDTIHFAAAPFLTKKELSPMEVPVIWLDGIPLLFPQSGNFDLPFDPFSAAFYMVSRYEEYINKSRDEHGRFQASSSLAFKHGFLELPVVDIWASMIRKVIEKEYPGYRFPEKIYSYIPTLDIDIAYSYKGRSLLRTFSSAFNNIFDFTDQVYRWNTLVRNKPDPFDTYHLFHQWHSEYNAEPIFFIHVGKYGRHDRCIPPQHPLMQQLIKRLASEYSVGIHPSYKSNSNPAIVKSEIEILSSILGEDVFRSRQHFLKFDISDTYQVLADAGIKDEYSMGFAEMPGFRAGTCTPFNYYNLLQEKETELKVYPFTFMDGNFINYLQISPENALDRMGKLVQTVKKCNGTLISIWHNNSLSDIKIWKGWREVYPKMLKLAAK